MRKILYILADYSPDGVSPLIPPEHSSDGQSNSVLLIQDGVCYQVVFADHVYVLSDDVASRNVVSPFSPIGYPDMLRMIFDADMVVAL